MAARKSKAGKGKAKSKRGNAPSVMGFLSKVGGMPRLGDTPAKGLLGDISQEDLREAGRLGADEPILDSMDPAAVVESAPEPIPEMETVATVEADLGEPGERWDHLEDIMAEDEAAASRLVRARQVGARTNRSSANSRQAERLSADLRVEYRNAGRVEVDLAADISTGGAFVRTATPLDVGDPILLTFEVPNLRFPLQIVARVKWVAPFGDKSRARPGMGVEFVALDDRKRALLEDLVRQARAEEQR